MRDSWRPNIRQSHCLSTGGNGQKPAARGNHEMVTVFGPLEEASPVSEILRPRFTCSLYSCRLGVLRHLSLPEETRGWSLGGVGFSGILPQKPSSVDRCWWGKDHYVVPKSFQTAKAVAFSFYRVLGFPLIGFRCLDVDCVMDLLLDLFLRDGLQVQCGHHNF